jgi:hypothetical protein
MLNGALLLLVFYFLFFSETCIQWITYVQVSSVWLYSYVRNIVLNLHTRKSGFSGDSINAL